MPAVVEMVAVVMAATVAEGATERHPCRPRVNRPSEVAPSRASVDRTPAPGSPRRSQLAEDQPSCYGPGWPRPKARGRDLAGLPRRRYERRPRHRDAVRRHHESPDIRAGMAMLLAALAAEGKSTIHNIGQIERGYERIHERLKVLGAKIERHD